MAKSLETSFYEKFVRGPADECWLWRGFANDKGYGRLSCRGRKSGYIPAHRFSYEMHKGKIPPGMFVLHSCDVKACVNPAHLRIGTIKDNVRDAIVRGQFVYAKKGAASPGAKLTDDAVRHIKRREMTRKQYAALYGVGAHLIAKIWCGVRWAHIS